MILMLVGLYFYSSFGSLSRGLVDPSLVPSLYCHETGKVALRDLGDNDEAEILAHYAFGLIAETLGMTGDEDGAAVLDLRSSI